MGLSSKRGKKKARRSDSDSQDDFESANEEFDNGNYSDDFEDGDSDDEDKELMDEDEDDEEEEDGEGEDDEEHNGVGEDDEMKELEKEYMELRNKEEDVLRNLKQHKDEDLRKGEAVKNQKALWDKTLELRFLLQKAFSSSNRLPQEPIRSSFCKSDEGVNKAYADMINSTKGTLDSLLKLQEELLIKNPSIAQGGEGNSAKSNNMRVVDNERVNTEDDEEWLQIVQMHNRIATFRDKSVDKWQRKTQVTSGVAAMKNKLHAFNQNISDQVSTYMRDPSRMLKQMRQSRSTISIFGASENVESTKGEEGNVDGDPELIDDTEFYQHLLKEFFETIDITSSEAAFYAVKRLQTKKRKIVDRRASKSRKIRYHVHEKIVNFMTPQTMVLPDMAPKLFQNLFGLRT